MRLLAPFQGRRITTTTTAHTRDTWEEFFFWAVYIFVFKKIIRRSQKDRANEWMEEEEKENKDWCEERERDYYMIPSTAFALALGETNERTTTTAREPVRRYPGQNIP